MKQMLAVLAILIMAFSFPVIAQDEGGGEAPAPVEQPSEPTPPPAEEPSEPVPPPEEPSEPVPPPIEGPVTPPGEPTEPVPVPEPGEPMQPGEPTEPKPPEGCWVGDQRVPCPGEEPSEPMPPGEPREPRGPNIPPGCREVRDPNGMIRIECEPMERPPDQLRCTPGPERERIEQKCREQGGRIVSRNIDPASGCGIIDCVFEGGGVFAPPGKEPVCPSPEMLMQKEEKCKQMGLNPVRKRSKCEYVECEDPNRQGFECPDRHEEWERIGFECSQKRGRVVKAFDEMGCNIPRCVVSGEDCPRDVPQEAYWKCEGQGGKLVVNTDVQGCITFSKCVKRGEAVREEDYNELDKVPPAAKLLQVALKLESIKISFDKLAKQIEAIAEYYESEDDFANAERFRRAAGMFESAKKQIDGVKGELKLAARGMSLEQLRNVKYKIRQITDVVMEDALFIILGGEMEEGYDYRPVEREDYEKGFAPENELDCGSNGMCFEKALRVCETGAVFEPGSNTELKIVGVDGSSCIIKAEADTPIGEMEMECAFPDYATQPLRPETLLPYCEGEMAEWAKNQYLGAPREPEPVQGLSAEQAFESQMMGCEKVERGINKRGVCGNGCCEERYGESYYDCPRDCMAPMEERQPRLERARQIIRGEPAGMGSGVRNKVGDTAILVSPSDGKSISGVVTVSLTSVPEGTQIAAFAIQGQGIPDMHKTGPNLGIDGEAIDGWSVMLDTGNYPNGLYTIYGFTWQQPTVVEGSRPEGYVSVQVFIDNSRRAEPKYDEGRFFDERRGPAPMLPEEFGERDFDDDFEGGFDDMDFEDEFEDREFEREAPVPEMPPASSEQPVAEETAPAPSGNGGGGSAETAASSGGEGVTAAAVLVNAVKELLGR